MEGTFYRQTFLSSSNLLSLTFLYFCHAITVFREEIEDNLPFNNDMTLICLEGER